jgi:CDP-6-deoxy-D-xylo-4-hexulose-3-dehydrase
MKIPLASTGLRQKDIEKAIEVLNSGNLTMGAKVKEFEHAMASYLKVKHFVMVNSGSSANLAIIEALMRPTKRDPYLEEGDGVLVPAIAWPTTIWPIIQLGLHPIFVDVDRSTLAIDLDKAQLHMDLSRRNIKAIFPIHPLGLAIESKRLNAFCEKNSLIQINDVCESLGSWQDGIHAGTSGLASSFSFYFSHHITTMEGGGIASNDDSFADDLRSIRSHGWSRDRSDSHEWVENISSNDSKFLFVSTGFNIRPMEIQAAIGVEQIKDIDVFVTKRRIIAQKIVNSLKGTKLTVVGGHCFDSTSTEEGHSWMLVPILCESLNQKVQVIKYLNDREIETRPVLTGNFLSQPAIERIDKHHADPKRFPVANEVTDKCFLVGAHHDLSNDQIEYLCKSIVEAADLLDSTQ